jgi:pyruvate/2-oxoglutarate dehydrogenase complex dihydrolipoamide acyltransferase (E2) component
VSTSVDTVDVTMPQLGETVSEGTITQWLKSVGDIVAEGDPLFEVSTDKVDTEIPASASGRLVEILVPVDATVNIGVRLAVIAADGRPQPSGTRAEPAPGVSDRVPAPAAERRRTAAPGPRHRASPLVRRLLHEQGLDESAVRGTGPEGRVTRADVATLLTTRPAKATARRTASARSAGHDGQVGIVAVDVDFHLIEALTRCTQMPWAGREEVDLGSLPFVAYAAIEATRSFPDVVATNSAGGGTTRRRPVHLAIGDDVLVENADDMQLVALARAMQVAPASRDALEATFWIRNPGRYGTVRSRSPLPSGAPAVLTVDAVRPTPVAVATSGDPALAIRPIAGVSLTYDAAVVVETIAARFVQRVRQILETADWAADLPPLN